MSAALLWLRRDLRRHDHPALAAAVRGEAALVPVFIWDGAAGAGTRAADWPPGAAARWWLFHSLDALGRDLRACGSRLTLRSGASTRVLLELVREARAQRVYWTECHEPAERRREEEARSALREIGVEVRSFAAQTLWAPAAIRTGAAQPYRVFTPFWRACLRESEPGAALPAPRVIPRPARWPRTERLAELGLDEAPPRAGEMRASWTPGERGAAARLATFLKDGVASYDHDRDRPGADLTSRLSPHLHFGEISVRRLWQAVSAKAAAGRKQRGRGGAATAGAAAAGDGGGAARGAGAYLRQLGWREFAAHLLWHFPHTPEEPLRPAFGALEWREAPRELRAWQRGETGYPLVDAGMRELWRTGWMHNRVRMVAASFLVKDLLLPWQAGARWFWDTLVDADLANNTLGWQWVAGCGADAAPFFRIFNPVAQGEKFDPQGAYVRRWVPELARLPAAWIHHPWDAPPAVLANAGVALGRDYPLPIVDHLEARARALVALARMQRMRTRRAPEPR